MPALGRPTDFCHSFKAALVKAPIVSVVPFVFMYAARTVTALPAD